MAPKFENLPPTPKTGGSKKGEKLPVKPTGRDGVPIIIEPRCNVCTSQHRHVIDQMLVGGYSFSEIARHFDFAGIERRSISNHKDKHLSYEEAAIRAVVEREAMLGQKNHDDGVERLITKQTYLEVALQKAYDQLTNNLVEIPAGDAVKLIEALQKLEAQHANVAVDEMRVQFQAFMQAVKEVCPPEMWELIRNRTHDVLSQAGRSSPLPVSQIQEAEVVDGEVDTP
jgi:hypothetical protein